MTETKKIKFNKKIKRKSRHHRNKIKFILKKTKKKHKLSGGWPFENKKQIPIKMPSAITNEQSIINDLTLNDYFNITPPYKDMINNKKIISAIILEKKVSYGKSNKRLFILFKNSDDDILGDEEKVEHDEFFPLVEYSLCYFDQTKNDNDITKPLKKKLKLYRFITRPEKKSDNEIIFHYKVGRFDSVIQSGLSNNRTFTLKHNGNSKDGDLNNFFSELEKAYDETFSPTLKSFLTLLNDTKEYTKNYEEANVILEQAEQEAQEVKHTQTKAIKAASHSAQMTTKENTRDISLGISYVGFFASMELFKNTANITPISAAIASLAAGVAIQITTVWENNLLIKQSYSRVNSLIKYIMKPLNELENLDKEISINSIEILVYLLMLLRKCKSWQKIQNNYPNTIYLTLYPSIYNNKIINICNKLEETIVLMSQILSIHVNINVLKLDKKIDTLNTNVDVLLKNQNSSVNNDDSQKIVQQ